MNLTGPTGTPPARGGRTSTRTALRPLEEVDHRQPLERGGEAYALANLATLCTRCHLDKTSRETVKDPARLAWRDYGVNRPAPVLERRVAAGLDFPRSPWKTSRGLNGALSGSRYHHRTLIRR